MRRCGWPVWMLELREYRICCKYILHVVLCFGFAECERRRWEEARLMEDRMIAVMTMNVGYFMSVLGGVFLGSLACGKFMARTVAH